MGVQVHGDGFSKKYSLNGNAGQKGTKYQLYGVKVFNCKI